MFVSSAAQRLKTATLLLFADRIEYLSQAAMLHPASKHWVPLLWVGSRASVKLAPTITEQVMTRRPSHGKRMPQRVEDVESFFV